MAATEYLSASEAAARKNVSRAAIYLAVRSGNLPHQIIAGKIVLKAKDVDAYEPIPNDERAGVVIGGRKRIKPVSDGPKKPRGRPKKQDAGISAEEVEAPETGA